MMAYIEEHTQRYEDQEKALFKQPKKVAPPPPPPEPEQPKKKKRKKKEEPKVEAPPPWKPFDFKYMTPHETEVTIQGMKDYLEEITHSPFPPQLKYKPNEKVLNLLIKKAITMI